MATNIKFITVVALIYATTVYWSCNKSILGCTESSYSFQLNAKAYPDKDTINVGDTIWIEINSPDVFTDQRSNMSINFSNSNNLDTYVSLIKLISVSPVQFAGAISQFKFNLISGTEIPNRLAVTDTIQKSFKINDVNGIYMLKIGIIPQSNGIFSFNLGNPAGVYRNGNSCPKADFFIRLTNTNQHYYLHPNGAGVQPGGSDYYFYVH
jgi:hypothetical protein